MTDTTTKHTDICKWFGGNGKHYGFIEPDGGGKSVLVA